MPGDIGAPPNSSGGSLSTKYAGIPAWGWLAIAAAGGVAIAVWLQYRRNGQDATEGATSGSSTGGSLPVYEVPAGSIVGANDSIDIGEFETLAVQVRDLQGKVSTLVPVPANTSTSTSTTTTPVTTTPVTTHPYGSGWYKVVRGDTISAIASKNGTSEVNVRTFNPSVNFSRLSVGQWIKVRSWANPSSGYKG